LLLDQWSVQFATGLQRKFITALRAVFTSGGLPFCWADRRMGGILDAYAQFEGRSPNRAVALFDFEESTTHATFLRTERRSIDFNHSRNPASG
jgi:hypothetical protein